MRNLVDPSLYSRERELDAAHGGSVVRFKSWVAIEVYGSSAHVKVDYDRSKLTMSRNENWPTRDKFDALNGKSSARFVDAVGYRTTKGLHLRAWTDGKLDDPVILWIQRLLGDDPRRQAFNAARVTKNLTNWNVLWNVKIRNGRVVSREVHDPVWTDRFRRWLRVE